jgi:hypothetical protein
MTLDATSPMQATTEAGRAAFQAQVASLKAQRTALNDQLISLTVRRDLLTQQLRNADDAGKAQLQAQIKDVGNRTASITAQMDKVDDAMNRLLARTDIAEHAEPAVPATPAQPAPPAFPAFPGITVVRPQASGNIAQLVGGAMALEALGFALVLFAMWRWLRHPRKGAGIPVRLAAEDAGRLDQLQRAVDVMAVEVERISESQRFVAKMLNDRHTLGAGPAQEVAMPARDAEEARGHRR